MENEPHHHTATFEKIWATLDRIAESQKEAVARMDRVEKQMEDTDRRLKKTDELFNSQWGKLMESLVEGDLVPLLQKRHIPVTHTQTRLQGPP